MKGGVDCGNARKQDVNIKQYEKIFLPGCYLLQVWILLKKKQSGNSYRINDTAGINSHHSVVS